MSNDSGRPILILDDDATFRFLVATLFSERGYQVVEARSAKEASALTQSINPALAIVDFRLGESDGISWITWLRNQGRNIPVVFVSGTWCDAKTFNWLRNILKVSLILRKPIVPQLFMQQLESLLPGFEESLRQPASMPAAPAEETVNPAQEAARIDQELEEIASMLDSGIEDAALVDQLKDKLRKLETRAKLEAAKMAYVVELDGEWKQLSGKIAEAQADAENGIAFAESIAIAHKVRGTSGSLGYDAVSRAAGQIEDLMRRFDPTDTLAEVLWTEIFRELATGELSIKGYLGVESNEPKEQVKPLAGNIFMIGDEEGLARYVPSINQELSMEATVCESVASALQRAKRTDMHAIVIDAELAEPVRICELPAELRAAQGEKVIPTAYLTSPNQSFTPSQLCYAGVSVCLNKPVSEELLTASLKRLLNVQDGTRQKVLTVDDDEVLTNFIASILTSNGLSVRTLNRPIMILEVMQEFRPDLVLLDVMMPGLSGYDVCRMLRASEEFGAVPIVFITSKSDKDGRAAAFQAGGDDFLSKPVLAEELTTRVLAQLELSVARRKAPIIDKATGVYNRGEFMQEAGKLLISCQESSVELAICLITIDEYASMSAAHSMFGAEQAIVGLSQLIRCHFKADVLRGRWSEGGFALAFPNESTEVAADAVSLMLDQFADMKLVSSTIGSFKSTFSAGLAGYPSDGETIEGLINTAYLRLVRGRQQTVGTIAYAG